MPFYVHVYLHLLGATPTGRKLQEVFDKYIPLIENKNLCHRPITVIVVTDGVPSSFDTCPSGTFLTRGYSPADDPSEVIIRAARRLDHSGVPREGRPFGIEFVQIGDDEEAAEALRELDDDIAIENGIRVGFHSHLGLLEISTSSSGHG